MFNPVATYRIQFHKGFTFNDLDRIVPYLKGLGISTLYASPIFEATPGSTHGYDIINPHRINPEIGTLKQLRALSKKLKEAGISWLQDIVPNHMAFHPDNAWLMDVLEKGALSAYANYFDMAGASELFHGRVMVPFLGSSLADVIRNKELTIAYENGRLVFKYFDNVYPLKITTYIQVLKAAKTTNQAVKQLILQTEQLQQINSAPEYAKAT
jgi:maltooligosyltrehalose synthase